MSDIILHFEEVTLIPNSHHVCSIEDVSFQINRGELILVRVDADCEHLPLPDLLMGLDFPDKGEITFLGENWKNINDFDRSALRGRIGYVSDVPNWISNLTVDENVMLAQRHHTAKSEEEIRAKIENLAEFAGLKGVPEVRPHFVHSRKLRLLEWVRAFAGDVDLFVLSCPERGTGFGYTSVLCKLIQQALEKGSAVLWITENREIKEEDNLPQNSEYVVKGSRLLLGTVKNSMNWESR